MPSWRVFRVALFPDSKPKLLRNVATAALEFGDQLFCDVLFRFFLFFLCEIHVLDQVCLLSEWYGGMNCPMVRVHVFFVTDTVG